MSMEAPSGVAKKHPLHEVETSSRPPTQYLKEGVKLALVPHKVSKVGDKAVALFIRGLIVGVFRINAW